MLKDYRDWLESELKLLGNASHHAYSFGQANMAKRALERLDALLEKKIVIVLEDPQARSILTAIEMLEQTTTSLDPALADLREQLRGRTSKE
ncbi:MAG TPA: hypothetical protein VN905_01110 [Candidatus Binatia bacterium]|nr:hypothetical protein [Candidatus Binatia bacterium]